MPKKANNIYTLLIQSFTNILKNKLSVFLLLATILNYLISWGNGNASEIFTIFFITYMSSFSEIYQNNKKRKTIKELKKQLRTKLKIIRNGKLVEKRKNKVGDIVFHQSGDRTICDLILIDFVPRDIVNTTNNLLIDQSMMTGESFPISKTSIQTIMNNKDEYKNMKEKYFWHEVPNICKSKLCKLVDRKIYGFFNLYKVNIIDSVVNSNSFIHQGSMFGIVIKKNKKSKFFYQKKNKKEINITTQARYYTERLTYLIILLCILFLFVGYLKTKCLLDSLKLSISLALTLAPEGLDASVQVVMLFISRRLMDINVYVNNFLKLEKLGNIDVICIDKTGTLTYNKQKLDSIYIYSESSETNFFKKIDNKEQFYENKIVYTLLRYCNEVIKLDGKLVGDPLDLALIEDIIKLKGDIKPSGNIKAIPFCPIKKTIEIETCIDSKTLLLIKGGVENILNSCKHIFMDGKTVLITEEKRAAMFLEIEYQSSLGKRIIGCCYKEIDANSYIFLSMITFLDPPRKGVKNSIHWCNENNIDITVVTGDSFLTTKSVCSSIGLLNNEFRNKFLKGNKIELIEKLDEIGIVYRAEPIHKQRLVEYYKMKNKSVLMTGDGMNDIMAMRQSCVSISMGSGSYFCKELSDIVILDDNFDNIVECIKAGRKGTHNVFCLFKYLISSNLGEFMCIALSVILCEKECLSSANLLLINLLTDLLPVVVICFNNGYVSKKKDEITLPIIFRSLLIGFYIGISTFLVYKNSLRMNSIFEDSYKRATTEITLFLIFCELVNMLNNISLRKSIFSGKIWVTNKYILPIFISTIFFLFSIVKIKILRNIFSLSEVPTHIFYQLFIFSMPVLIIDEVLKLWFP